MVLVQDKLPNYVHAEMSDIQIMTPMRKGALGVEALNKQLQEKFNPPAPNKQEKESGGTIFRVGDKVMQIKNNYQIEWEVRNRYGIPVDKGEAFSTGIRDHPLHQQLRGDHGGGIRRAADGGVQL